MAAREVDQHSRAHASRAPPYASRVLLARLLWFAGLLFPTKIIESRGELKGLRHGDLVDMVDFWPKTNRGN